MWKSLLPLLVGLWSLAAHRASAMIMDRCYGDYENFQVETRTLNTYQANVRYSVVPPDPDEFNRYSKSLPDVLSLDPLTGRITGVHRFNQSSLRRRLQQEHHDGGHDHRRLECSQGFDVKILVENLDTDEEETVDVSFFTFPCELPVVSHFMIVDTKRNADVRPMIDDDVLYLGWLDDRFSIRAIVFPEEADGGCVGSGQIVDKVKFVLDGRHVRTESFAPYALGGDRTGLDGWGDFYNFNIEAGPHTLVATAIDDDGNEGPPTELSFTVYK